MTDKADKSIPELFNGFHESFMPDVDEVYIFNPENYFIQGLDAWTNFIDNLQLWYDFGLIEIAEILAGSTPAIVCYGAKITDKGKAYIDLVKI